MSNDGKDNSDKSHEPTPEKLRQAREKGDVAKSADVSVAASYSGLLLALMVAGSSCVIAMGSSFEVLLGQPDLLMSSAFEGSSRHRLREVINHGTFAAAPLFVVPFAVVLLSILAQRSLVVTPSKLAPKLSRISLVSNAKQKFGRNGAFEFAKSLTKLLLFSAGLALFFHNNLLGILALSRSDAAISVPEMGRLGLSFLKIVTMISLSISGIDAIWQYFELRRRNRMSRQDLLNETKAAEGDPHLKQARRRRGQEIATNQMVAKVREADVVVVNPTHYAVALKWSRLPGSAPTCVAKGADETARAIREAAGAAGVPIHSDPATARALFATVETGSEIGEELYPAVAVAIRFADEMRQKAKERVY